jgi:hypothetical protein
MPLPSHSRRAAEAPIMGESVGSLTTSERIRLDPSPAFLLSCSPESYELSEISGEPVYLPTIQRHDVSPGSNGVDKGGGTAHLASNLQTRGQILIQPHQCPAEMTPDGRPGYLRRYDGTQGAIHLEAWVQVVKAPGNKHATQLTKPNEQSFRKWRLWLMEAGVVPFPSEDWIERYEDRLGERAQRRATQAAAPEVKAERAAEAEANLRRARKARANVAEVANG